MAPLTYSHFEHLLLIRLDEAPEPADGSLIDLQELMADVEQHDWVADCAAELDERGLIQAAIAMGNAASARILPDGRKYADKSRDDVKVMAALDRLLG